MTEITAVNKPGNPFVKFFRNLGPGFVTGAADDDPSGIGTYTIAGAQFGLGLVWLSWFTWPFMGAVQQMCARIGMVTGMGLAAALREKFPSWMVLIAALALMIANTINVGSDLAAMAEACQILTGWSRHIFVVILGVAIAFAMIMFRYEQIANVLKYLALFLCAYIIATFMVRPNWGAVIQAAFTPHIPEGGWGTIVAILGTTISPYLFFWQTSSEVEEEKKLGKLTVQERYNASEEQLSERRMDIAFGTFFSNLIMFFCIVCTALTLNVNKITDLSSTGQIAQALVPFGGPYSMLIFTIGIIGVGLLAIPTMAGSAAYAFAECFDWHQGLDEKWHKARSFYTVIIISTLIGIGMDFININPVSALWWTAVVNGVLAPFLLVGIWLIARDPEIMRGQTSSRLSQTVVGITILMMFGACVGVFTT